MIKKNGLAFILEDVLWNTLVLQVDDQENLDPKSPQKTPETLKMQVEGDFEVLRVTARCEEDSSQRPSSCCRLLQLPQSDIQALVALEGKGKKVWRDFLPPNVSD